ncbi:hypothetical protein [Microvirga massiliensis]|uniref:hypothetical protein n=1 Tax=Microvirga massiliensis TaxID=1033741 RepID=UPI00062BC012|nr:hypothetical protein [Microvirga massiliensis]
MRCGLTRAGNGLVGAEGRTRVIDLAHGVELSRISGAALVFRQGRWIEQSRQGYLRLKRAAQAQTVRSQVIISVTYMAARLTACAAQISD